MLIERPRGVVPRAKGCGLGPEFAQIAENINLSNGLFEPWRQPVSVLEFPFPVTTAHVRNCCWAGVADCDARYVDAGLPRKTYLSSPTTRPTVTDDLCAACWSYVGYPVPDGPEAILDCVPTKDAGTQRRAYVITYGTDCEEGPPSCPTNLVDVAKDSIVGIQLPARPDAMWGATHVNIYRTEALWDSDQGLGSFNPNDIDAGWNASTAENEYFLIARCPVNTPYWLDDGTQEVGKLLTTEELLPPVEGTVLVGETESGSLVGFTPETNTVIFSERNKYWGFPFKTAHTFPSQVKDVKICGDTVFVLTCEQPFILQDGVDCKDATSRPVTHVKSPLPLIGCESCVVVEGGIVYNSLEGLVLLRIDGSHTMTSRGAFEKRDWSLLDPSQIRLGKGCDHLFVSTREGLTYVWVLSFDENGYLPSDVTTLSFAPAKWLNDEQDRLYMLSNNQVLEFNAGDYLQMRWRQVDQRSTVKRRVSAIRGEYVKKNTVHFNSFSLYRNGSLSVTRALTDKGARIRSTASDCTAMEIKGSEPMCWIGAGAGLSDIERRPT